MKKVFKRMIIIFAVLFALIGLIVVTSFTNHQIKLSKENKLFIPNGQMVDVNGQQMHVYIEGDGEETLVFMSGGGTSSPVLDFKSLYTLLSEKYKIIVIEKAGYGFSDVTNSSRDIDTILSETRESLFTAGIEGPFILVPHSMSGIEALHWADMYPDEIKAIIGLDMAVPDVYDYYPIHMPLIYLSTFAAKSGVIRWLPGLSESDAIKYGSLTDEEKELYRMIFYRRTLTTNMINEIKQVKANARIVEDNPNVPMLLFASNGEGTGLKEETWIKFQEDFMRGHETRKLITLDASHYIHNIAFEQIANESEKFIEKLNE